MRQNWIKIGARASLPARHAKQRRQSLAKLDLTLNDLNDCLAAVFNGGLQMTALQLETAFLDWDIYHI